MENVRKHRDIKLLKAKARVNCFDITTKLSYSNFFVGKFISNRNEKQANKQKRKKTQKAKNTNIHK